MTKKTWLWRSNPDWYDYDENDRPYLTEAAPPEAVEDFEKWQRYCKRIIELGIVI